MDEGKYEGKYILTVSELENPWKRYLSAQNSQLALFEGPLRHSTISSNIE